MWVAHFKVWHKNSPLLMLCDKYDMHAVSQYLNNFEEDGVPKIMRVATFWGKDKEKVIEEVSKEPRVKVIHREGDQLFFTQDAIRSFHTMVSDRNIFFLEPILEEKGFQWWTIGSNKKENLLEFYEKVNSKKDFATIELLSIKKRKYNIFFQPKLNESDAIGFNWWKKAVEAGYYEYPRRISLSELSKKLGIPFSTLKDHLRKTERALMKELAKSA